MHRRGCEAIPVHLCLAGGHAAHSTVGGARAAVHCDPMLCVLPKLATHIHAECKYNMNWSANPDWKYYFMHTLTKSILCALHCVALRCIALRCNALQCVALRCIALLWLLVLFAWTFAAFLLPAHWSLTVASFPIWVSDLSQPRRCVTLIDHSMLSAVCKIVNTTILGQINEIGFSSSPNPHYLKWEFNNNL